MTPDEKKDLLKDLNTIKDKAFKMMSYAKYAGRMNAEQKFMDIFGPIYSKYKTNKK